MRFLVYLFSLSFPSILSQKAGTVVKNCFTDQVCCIKLHEAWYRTRVKNAVVRPASNKKVIYTYEPLTSLNASLSQLPNTIEFYCASNMEGQLLDPRSHSMSGPFFLTCPRHWTLRIVGDVPIRSKEKPWIQVTRGYCIAPRESSSLLRAPYTVNTCLDFPPFWEDEERELIAWVSISSGKKASLDKRSPTPQPVSLFWIEERSQQPRWKLLPHKPAQ